MGIYEGNRPYIYIPELKEGVMEHEEMLKVMDEFKVYCKKKFNVYLNGLSIEKMQKIMAGEVQVVFTSRSKFSLLSNESFKKLQSIGLIHRQCRRR